MKIKYLSLITALITAGTFGSHASLVYDFNSGLDGFVNLTLAPAPAGWTGGGVAQMTHTAGGWQSQMAKEFSWGPGGGNANQQLEMQSLAYGDLDGNEARLQFDVILDDASFPANLPTWWQLNMIGNSAAPLGWTQTQILDGWHEPGNPQFSGLRTWHFDVPFSALGWEAGDEWFQFHLASNSGDAVNFYIDNVVATLVPEPTSLSLAALGALALLISRRRN